jgi:hypothetical protein
MKEIVRFLIRRSRRPEALPMSFPPWTCRWLKSHRTFFLRMRRNRRSNRQPHGKAARESRTGEAGAASFGLARESAAVLSRVETDAKRSGP